MLSEFKLKIKQFISLQNIGTISLIVFVISILIFPNSSITIQGLPSYLTTQIFHIPSIILAFLLIIINKGRISLNIPSIIALITIVYIILSQIYVGGDISDIMASPRAISYFILASIFLQYLSKTQFFIICDWILWYCLGAFLFDTFYRFSIFGFHLNFSMIDIYRWKTESLLFFDTNTFGVLTLIITFFAYYLYDITKQNKYLFFTLMFIILTIWSYSRAAMLGIVITFANILLLKLLKKLLNKSILNVLPVISIGIFLRFILLIIFILLSIYAGIKIFIFLINDSSFLTKLDLLSDTILFIKKANLEQLFLGTGFGNAELFTGRYAHAYIPTYIIETGLIGYTLVTLLLISIFLYAKKTILILLPFIVISISFIAHYGLGLFYTALAFICFYEHHFKGGEEQIENSSC